MEFSLEVWNLIFESCKSFVEKRKLYNALPDSFKKQYPKSFNYPDGDKHLLNYLILIREYMNIRFVSHFSVKRCNK
jgi:hypothetical protein